MNIIFIIKQFFFSFLFFLIIFVFSLIITISIALLTLVERKVLSIVQRRVGPNHIGYRGRLQFIADALKLLLKGINIPDLTNKKLFIIIPLFSLFICYTFWANSIWGSNIIIAELEYNIIYTGVMSILFSLCTILIGIFSRNKYSVLSAIRCCCMVLNLELFLSFLFLFVLSYSESFSFSSIINLQSHNFYFINALCPLLPIIIVIFLLETNRAPFDLVEAESELIAGYTTELGGFFFALFYLGEYFHLFFFSLVLSSLLLGGWN